MVGRTLFLLLHTCSAWSCPGPRHSSVGLDLRTEKSGFFAIWTGLGLDLTSYVGLWILAFGMECQSIPSHQTLKQKNCQNWTNFLLFCICDTVNFKTFDKIKTSGAYVDIKIIGYNFDQYNPWTWLWNWIGLKHSSECCIWLWNWLKALWTGLGKKIGLDFGFYRAMLCWQLAPRIRTRPPNLAAFRKKT